MSTMVFATFLTFIDVQITATRYQYQVKSCVSKKNTVLQKIAHDKSGPTRVKKKLGPYKCCNGNPWTKIALSRKRWTFFNFFTQQNKSNFIYFQTTLDNTKGFPSTPHILTFFSSSYLIFTCTNNTQVQSPACSHFFIFLPY
eukprot:Phypoly_transcript_20643.p1 GENE.Phypoly_transcript_20643~~Phypoly_transcript_20643.p1  ORF type:complete len:142 (+),score=3.69 Phypoly_transcript_20643:23-448(+)